MPIKIVNLPCKASELAETIRCFCEHNGSFDTAIVTLESKQVIDSFTPVIPGNHNPQGEEIVNNLIQWPTAKYWTAQWNPIIGCKPCSPACENCYAAA